MNGKSADWRGDETSFCFYGNTPHRDAKWNRDESVAMFSFEGLYEAVMQAVGEWAAEYSGNLERQLTFVARYDQILSEGRVVKLSA